MREVDIIGVGPGNPELLTGSARTTLAACDVVIGSARALATVAGVTNAPQVKIVRAQEIASFLAEDGSWARASVVMTGDVGMFSGAKRLVGLLREEPDITVEVHPGVGSAAYLAARLERPWEAWRFASAHGMSCDIVAQARLGGSLFLVTSNGQTPAEMTAKLTEAGWGDAVVTVAEELSYPGERIVCATAREVAHETFADLNVMLIDFGSAPDAAAAWPYATPGIPDELLCRGKVPMTKSEVRAVALSKLKVAQTDVVWDVGAGTGSVSIEAALLAGRGLVCAVERKPEAVELIRRNAAAFGLANLEVTEGKAPQALEGLPVPDAVFIGGSAGQLEAIVERVLGLNPAARLCVTCVTIETLGQACALLSGERFDGFEICQVAVSRAEELGSYHLMRAQNPVFVVSATGRGPAATCKETQEGEAK